METALDIFRLMMREEIAPELRRMGFKGSGQTFTLPSQTHWVLLGFQKSRHGRSDWVQFTVNVTVVSRRVWEEEQGKRSFLSERPSANTMYGPWAWQRRIGLLLPVRQDTWWTIETRPDAESARIEVLDAIRTYALPAIEQQLAEHPREG